VFQQGKGDSDERQDKVDGEQVLGSPRPGQLNQVEEEDRTSNDRRLSHLDAIDPREDVDGIGAEHRQHPHVQVVENTCVCMCECVSVSV